MLVASNRINPADMKAWQKAERVDALNATIFPLPRMAEKAIDTIRKFATAGPCYAGVSWGKDSVVMAHLLIQSGVKVPLVWVRVEPIANPDCVLVRDAFLAAHDCDYHEFVTECPVDASGAHAKGTLEAGFKQAIQQFGVRHISGVRGEESGMRKMRMMRWGTTSLTTCAPIGWWKAAHVYAYLYAHQLPVHPAYAMTMGGLLDRDRLRVASIGGNRGIGMGRAEWERMYYPEQYAVNSGNWQGPK